MVKLLAAYITRNAGHFFDASLSSVRPYVDGIVVVDDHSTDDTIEIATLNGAHIVEGDFGRNKAPQRQTYLDYADEHGYDWIMTVDDDEVYTEKHMENLMRLIEEAEKGDYVAIRYEFLHFWKRPDRIIKGHHWNNRLERCFKNQGGMRYNMHHMVSDRNGKIVNGDAFYGSRILMPGPDVMQVHHYSWMKPAEHIRDKIRYYMLRDNPNCTEENVEAWVDRHPYFSDDLLQPRYGDNGLFIAGTVGNQCDKVVEYDGEHPRAVFRCPQFYAEYNKNAEKYMVDHWQHHNHLDYPRHQRRIKMAATLCSGRTLEVGCANGFSTMTMQRANPEASFEGVEVTEWGHEEAKGMYPDGKWYRANGESLPFQNCEFDTVILPEIIEHCMCPRALADEAWRVCAKRMIITTPTKEHPDPDHKRYFTLAQMDDFLAPYKEQGATVWFTGLTQDGNEPNNADEIYFAMAVVDRGC